MKLPRGILFTAACILPALALAPISRAETGVTNLIDGATVNYTGDWMVGTNGPFNAQIVTNAGILAVTGTGIIGNSELAASNYAIVTGPGSLWSNSGSFILGDTGSFNRLTINNGGMMAGNGGVLGGSSTSSNNTALVTGSGSVWKNNNSGGGLIVGYSGSGNQLTISNGAQVVFGTAPPFFLSMFGGVVGLNSNANDNAVLVTGSGSVWSNASTIRIGGQNSGNSLVISDGGQVISSGGTVGSPLVASFALGVGFTTFGISNNVTITGTGSIWKSSGDIWVGSIGASNELIVSNGGLVTNTGSLSIGNNVPPCVGNKLVLAQGTVFASSINVATNNSIVGYGTLSGGLLVNGGQVAVLTGGQTLTIHNPVRNDGMLIADNGGTLDFYGPVLNLGTTNFTGGNAIFRSLLLSSSFGNNNWTSSGDGNWSESAQWSAGQSPSAAQSYIYLTNDQNKTVTVNAATVAAAPQSLTNFSVIVSAPAGGHQCFEVRGYGIQPAVHGRQPHRGQRRPPLPDQCRADGGHVQLRHVGCGRRDASRQRRGKRNQQRQPDCGPERARRSQIEQRHSECNPGHFGS